MNFFLVNCIGIDRSHDLSIRGKPKASSLLEISASFIFGKMTNEEFIKRVSLDGEEWRGVVGYEETYMVSSFGRVMSKHRIVRNRYSVKEVQPRLLNPHITHRRKDYRMYELKVWKGSVGRTLLLHKAIATAFIDNPNDYKEIDHIDGNPLNNHISNLRWCDHSTNVNNSITRQRQSNAKRGLYNTPKSKSVVQILEGKLINTYPSLSEAERNGFKHSKIHLCCCGKRNKHKGYQWMYLSDYETSINKSKNT